MSTHCRCAGCPFYDKGYHILTVTVSLTTNAQDQFNELPRPIQRRVVKVFERLEKWPEVSGAKPLRGALAGRFRIRTGDYRVQFVIEQQHLVIEKLGHRDGFYDS